MFIQIILLSSMAALLGMIGGMLLLWKEKLARRASIFLISFAAGVLLGVAFFDLLHESVHELGSIDLVAVIFVSTVILFFAIEKFLWWFHHHRLHTKKKVEDPNTPVSKHQVYMLISGDALHHFVDGALIASAFMIDYRLGIAVVLGVIAHEVPHQIADFGVMISAGFERAKVLLFNFGAALANPLGAILAYTAISFAEQLAAYMLPIAMGVFAYIALVDLFPAIHKNQNYARPALKMFLVVLGAVFVFFATDFAHSIGGDAHHHEHGDERKYEDDDEHSDHGHEHEHNDDHGRHDNDDHHDHEHEESHGHNSHH